MKSIFRIRLPRLGRKESGFTLVELLVVVGIIVALAAVIVPSIAAVSGKGEQGARDSERENVQSAMDTLMADIGITTVNANDLLADSSVADFSTTGFGDLDPGAGTAYLSTYLRNNTTKYWYCWDSAGLILSLDYSGSIADCTDGDEP